MTNEKLIWQTRDEMPTPFAFTSRDCSEDKMIAFMYGIVMGWDDDAYAELKAKHNWSDEDVRLQKLWHENYNKAWNAWMNGEGGEK